MDNNNINPNASYSDPVRQEPNIRTAPGGIDSPKRSGKGFPKWIAAVIGVMLILAVGGFFIARSLGETEDSEPTPSGAGLSTFPTPNTTSTPEASPSPEARDVDKSEVKIEVLNGTGTAGEASFLKGKLEDLGYENIEAANADTQDAKETTVTFASDLPDEIVDEITEELEDIYTSVESQSGTVSGGFDVRIITGPRSGAATSTPRASATGTPKATSTASPTASATATSSPSN